MSKKEWIKTILAGAGAVALMLLLGDRNAFYNWVETLVMIGILAGGFYKGFAGGLTAGTIGGLVRWYVLGGELIQVPAMTAGGICGALFRQLGKGASCLAFVSGTALCYLFLQELIPYEMFDSLLLASIVFLIVSPKKIRRRNRLHPGNGTSGSGMGNIGNNTGNSAAAEEMALTVAPSRDFSAAGQSWRRLADNFMTLGNCFDDQSLLLVSDVDEELTAIEWKQRFLESRQAIRLQFMEVGKVIREQQQKIDALQDVTELYEDKIELTLKRHRLQLHHLQIMQNPRGRQEIFARLTCKKGTHMSAQEVSALFHTEHGKKFCPAYDCRSVVGHQEGDVHFIERQSYQILHGLSRKKKEGETCSGDSFSVKMLGEEKMLLCLSDGMGTGKKAGLESKMVVELLEQLLENGFSLMAAISMINHILLNWRSKQTPTTLDICLTDLYSGTCQFAKMGAAAGYLKRGTNVSAIRGQSIPLGMIPWETLEENLVPEENLQSGDMLIMMTDGALEKAGLAADEILKDLIAGCTLRNAQEIADWLMEQLLLLDETIQDDMTILVAGIWRK